MPPYMPTYGSFTPRARPHLYAAPTTTTLPPPDAGLPCSSLFALPRPSISGRFTPSPGSKMTGWFAGTCVYQPLKHQLLPWLPNAIQNTVLLPTLARHEAKHSSTTYFRRGSSITFHLSVQVWTFQCQTHMGQLLFLSYHMATHDTRRAGQTLTQDVRGDTTAPHHLHSPMPHHTTLPLPHPQPTPTPHHHAPHHPHLAPHVQFTTLGGRWTVQQIFISWAFRLWAEGRVPDTAVWAFHTAFPPPTPTHCPTDLLQCSSSNLPE